ncbi:MAG TPA: hypothetical protein PKE12_10335 [Kiritimatiellia bacterium]|nr:hypothetical protein [Kiritimatiellia bacterium]
MKRIRFLLFVLLVAAGTSRAQEEFTFAGEILRETPVEAWASPDAGLRAEERVRVAFYNIEHFTDAEGDGPDRTLERATTQARGAAALVDEIRPDILLIAEIENAASLRMLNDVLAEPFPFGWVTKFGDGSQNEDKLNNALLSRVPPLEVLELDYGPLQGRGRPPRGALRATFDLGGDHRLVVYAIHLKSNFGNRSRNMHLRKNALQFLADDARELSKDESIRWEFLVLGDVNVDPEQGEFAGDWSLNPLRGWRDLWRGRPLHERTTVPTRYGDPALEFPPAAFDRIYAGGDATNAPWRAGEAEVLQRGTNTRNVKALPGVDGHVSDHYPVWVDVVR